MKKTLALLLVALVCAGFAQKNNETTTEPVTPLFPASQDSVSQVTLFRPKLVMRQELLIPKDPFLGGALSLVLPGAGQAYCGKWFKGVGFLVGSFLCYGLAGGVSENQELAEGPKNLMAAGLLLTGLAVHGWSVIDGVNGANRHNRRLLDYP